MEVDKITNTLEHSSSPAVSTIKVTLLKLGFLIENVRGDNSTWLSFS